MLNLNLHLIKWCPKNLKEYPKCAQILMLNLNLHLTKWCPKIKKEKKKEQQNLVRLLALGKTLYKFEIDTVPEANSLEWNPI